MNLILFVLIAIPLHDATVAVPGHQTIRYFETIAECHTERNRIEPTINKSFIRLDCVPVKITSEQ